MSFWFFVKPESTTNLITNPSVELATTGYSAANGAALARSTEQQAIGLYSLKVTPTSNTADGAFFGSVTLEVDTPHTFSVSVFGANGVPYRVYLWDVTAGAIRGTPATFTGDGTWRRQVVTATTHAANTAYRVYVVKNSSASIAPFYIDALQLEQKSYATTYADGDQDGCLWSAGAHVSSSTRSANSNAGGRVYDFEDPAYGIIQEQSFGVGAPPLEIIDTRPAQGDGSDYQKTVVLPRQFQLTGTIQGQGSTGLAQRTSYHTKRHNLMTDLSHHRLATELPIQVRYGFNTKAVAINAFFESGLERNSSESPIAEKISLRFRATEDPFWRKVMGTANGDDGGQQGAADLTVQSSLTNVNYIIQQQQDGTWAKLGTGFVLPTPGVANDAIYTVAVGGDGSIYIGGVFTSVGGIANTTNIARWDGTAWTALGTGANGLVRALAVAPDGTLYASGDFTSMGGVADTSRIAKWDGSAWSALGTGANNTCEALAVAPDGTLYAGGTFTQMGGVANTAHVAKWNGSAWTALTTGLNDAALALAVAPDGTLYVGGAFTLAGGVANTVKVARWNGSAWSALGTGANNNSVFALAVDPSGTLYAGGSFTQMSSVAGTTRVARWNGTAWSALGTGADDNVVLSLAIDPSGVLYAGGSFTAMSGVAGTDFVARWDGVEWLAMGTGANDTVLAVAISPRGMLYAAGEFTSMSGVSNTNFLARWNGTDWRTINTAGRALARNLTGLVFAGGGFSSAGGVGNTGRIADWNGSVWDNLTTGANGVVHALAVAPNGDLYIGGSFTSVGGVANTKGVARWNGSSWAALSTGVNGTVLALAFAPNGDLYIGGNFLNAAGVADTRNLARWNGSAFTALSTGANGAVNALAVAASGDLYIGGSFTALGGTACSYIGLWDGTAFSAVGAGTNGFVNALAVQADDSIILGGVFTQAGGVTVNYIARWNGSSYSGLATGVNNFVYCLAVSSVTGAVYAGGAFTEAGGVSLTDKIAIFTGTIWSPISADLPGNAVVEAVLTTATGLFICFDTSGTATSAALNPCVNIGNANTYPVLKLEGPGKIFGIENISTGDVIYFDYELLTGESATLDLRPGTGNPFISTFRGNINNLIVEGSDVETFHLKPGANDISIFINNASATAALLWDIKHFDFDGVVV